MKNWYESRAVWGGLVAIGAALAGALGHSIDSTMQDQLVDYAIAIVGVIGGIVAIYGRVKAEGAIRR